MLLEGEGLCRRYGRGDAAVTALADAALAIQDGEFVAIMGPSGLGQVDADEPDWPASTGRPAAGYRLRWPRASRGCRPTELAGLRNRAVSGFVFQSYNLLARHYARVENVELPLVYGGIKPSASAGARARGALDAVGLGRPWSTTPSPSSRAGEQQRVAIARAMVNEPGADPRRRADR